MRRNRVPVCEVMRDPAIIGLGSPSVSFGSVFRSICKKVCNRHESERGSRDDLTFNGGRKKTRVLNSSPRISMAHLAKENFWWAIPQRDDLVGVAPLAVGVKAASKTKIRHLQLATVVDQQV